MKILALGDPHGKLPKDIEKIIKKNKISAVIINGDLGNAGLAKKLVFRNVERVKKGLPKLKETKAERIKMHMQMHNSTLAVARKLSLVPVYSLEGNVRISGTKKLDKYKKRFGISLPLTLNEVKKIKNFNLIKRRIIFLNKLKIGFYDFFSDISWVEEFKPGNYNKLMNRAKKQSATAKMILKTYNKLDILVTHQPPYGILDKVNSDSAPKDWQGKHAGSKIILEYIKKYRPRLVLCGHIHEAKGEARIGKTKVINLGCCGDYKIIDI